MQLPQDQGPRKFLEGTIRVSLMGWYIRQVPRSNLEAISSFLLSDDRMGGGEGAGTEQQRPGPAWPLITLKFLTISANFAVSHCDKDNLSYI